MSCNFLQMGNMLSGQTGGAFHRQVFIFAGDSHWQQDILKELLRGNESDSLWIADHAPEQFPAIPFKKARGWLGREKYLVVFDATENFDVDAFAAISGVVVGGGIFILLMPAKEKWHAVYSSHFGQRLTESINANSRLNVINHANEKINFIPAAINDIPQQKHIAPFLTRDQQCAVEKIEEQILKDTSHPVVLISDRGRGKSASLGIAAARLVKAGIKHIAITAPRLRASDIIFKHLAALLPDAEVSRGYLKYGESIVQFYSPDQLMQNTITAELLLVDEAAAIPVPLLTSFLQHFPQCVFATTVHGYEGTGRGFSLRFTNILNEQKPGWLKLNLQEPIRWAENDPLEQWMLSLLCLDAELTDVSSIDEVKSDELDYKLITREQLSSNQALLKEVFALLVLAHYRTRPSDLKNLLDDDTLSLYLTLYKNHVIAVALVIREGHFPVALSTSVYRGERRPPGNLLAQALTYHCGVEHAATLDYARVMRIAVHPEIQQQGIGTELLDFIVANENKSGRDVIGTSFGMNKSLLDFWKKSGFDVVRIGFTREQTSGEHAAIMLLPLSQQGKKVYREAQARFITQLPFWFEDVLKDIPAEIKELFQLNKKSASVLTEYEEKDLQSFIHYSRNYELCIGALNKLVASNQAVINRTDFPAPYRQIINYKVLDRKNWSEITKNMVLSSQKDARKYFQQAIGYLFDYTVK